MRVLILLVCISFCVPALSQKEGEKITGEAAKQIMQQLQFDSTAFLGELSKGACNCIDSVARAQPDRKKKMDAFSRCIGDAANAYQLSMKLMASMKSGGKENKIELNINENSRENKRYYYEVESWLKDSCKALNAAIASDDDAKEKSYSKNPDAMAAYDKGVDFLRAENYAEAIPWFEKAVKTDNEFAFAWDNLGICYRRTGKFDKAESAYKASLKVDPTGKTALQNLAVVYLFQKKDDQAITAYKEILKYYPDNPEAFYGVALVYINNKKDFEKGLDNMCKAYNLYVKEKSAYRSDAEKVINMVYAEMKKENKTEVFKKILKDNNISTD